jgi:predicted RNA-binding Zn ribbon-like protein
MTAAGLAYLIADTDCSRIRCCQRPDCTVAFVDTSRNGHSSLLRRALGEPVQ